MNAANGEGHRQKENTEDNQLPITSLNRNLDPDLDIEAEYEEDVETLIDNARLTPQEVFQNPL